MKLLFTRFRDRWGPRAPTVAPPAVPGVIDAQGTVPIESGFLARAEALAPPPDPPELFLDEDLTFPSLP
jgi:hypothetical protein